MMELTTELQWWYVSCDDNLIARCGMAKIYIIATVSLFLETACLLNVILLCKVTFYLYCAVCGNILKG